MAVVALPCSRGQVRAPGKEVERVSILRAGSTLGLFLLFPVAKDTVSASVFIICR